MPLLDLLKKKEKIKEDVTPSILPAPQSEPTAEGFTFLRSDTNTQELISPSSSKSEATIPPAHNDEHRLSSHFSRLRSSSNASTSSRASTKGDRRLSQRLHISRSSSRTSVNIPTNLPDIADVAVQGEEKEAQWEVRATILAKENPNVRSVWENGSLSAEDKFHQEGFVEEKSADEGEAALRNGPGATCSVGFSQGDDNIQEAIRLHEAGDLPNSTAMFGRLAGSDAMAQIMYGLALRHGWGISPDPPLAIQYLSAAASSSATIESAALQSGLNKGGAAKGELVLAMYELANSFRHGWGVQKDMVAARKYYETAANLGDTDAMNEVARCYETGEGGGGKDRVSYLSPYLPSLP